MKRSRATFDSLNSNFDENINDASHPKKQKIQLKESLEIFHKLISTIQMCQNKRFSQNDYISSLERFCDQVAEGNSTKIFLELIILKFRTSKIPSTSVVQEKILSQIQFELTQKTSSLLKYAIQRENMHLCPISKSLMSTPCTLKKSGIVYEKNNILHALKYKLKCPVTNMNIIHDSGNNESDNVMNINDLIVLNYDKKNAIENFKNSFYDKASKILRIIKDIILCHNNSNNNNMGKDKVDVKGKYLSYDLSVNVIEMIEYINRFKMICSEIINVHEMVLLSQPYQNEFFNSYIMLIKEMESRKKYKKALEILNSLMHREKNNMNNEQIEKCLNMKLSLLLKDPKSSSNSSSNDKSVVKNIVIEIINHYKDNEKYNEANKMFKRFKSNYFIRKTIPNLCIEASITTDDKVASKIYYDIGIKYYNKGLYNESKKYLIESIGRDKRNINAREKLINVCKKLNDSKETIIESYIYLGELNAKRKEYYYREAYLLDMENENVVEKYLSVLLEKNKIDEYMNVSKSDVGRRVMLRRIVELNQRNVLLEGRVSNIEEKIDSILECEMRKIVYVKYDDLKKENVLLSDEINIKNHKFKLKSTLKDGNLSMYLFCIGVEDEIKLINFSIRVKVDEHVYFKNLKKKFEGTKGWGGVFCERRVLDQMNSEEIECTVCISDISTIKNSNQSQYGLFDDD